MSRVRRVEVVPDLVLVVRVNYLLRGALENGRSLAKEGLDEWLKSSHNEDTNRVGDLLNQGAETRDFLDCVRDFLGDIVTEAEDLPDDTVELLRGHSAGVLARGTNVRYVIHLAAEVTASATRKVKEELTKGVGRGRLSLVDRASAAHRLCQVGHRCLQLVEDSNTVTSLR